MYAVNYSGSHWSSQLELKEAVCESGVSIGLNRTLNCSWRIFYIKSRYVHRFGGYFYCFKTKNESI